MSYRYDGITPETLMLLSENRFRNSRDFYEENKKRIKEGITIPLQQIICALSDTIIEIDEDIPIIPQKMVSRVRRDTRYTKDKHMYRENLWAMFTRDKHALPHFPCMWFEFFPDGYSYGVAMFRYDAKGLAAFRQKLIDKPDEFRRALTSVEITGAQLFIESFKKNKPDIDKVADDLKLFYNAKDFGFTFHSGDMIKLIDGSIIEELTYAVRAFEPMYKFLAEITDDLMAKGE